MYRPSHGHVYICGLDMATELNKIRPSIGFCPQHDILYDELTVEEHLKLIAMVYES